MVELPFLTEPLLVCVIVHDRFKNVKRWIECWRHCNQYGGKLAVIHNNDAPSVSWRNLAKSPGLDYYINRPNLGFDVGALQALHAGELGVDFQWKHLLWICDDSLPMNRDFVGYLARALFGTTGAGVVGVELSEEVRFHMRTNMYMIRKETLDRIVFPANPTVTKSDSYMFEHWCPKLNLSQQIKDMGLSVLQADPSIHTIAWDTGHHRNDDRWREFWSVFPTTKPLGRQP